MVSSFRELFCRKEKAWEVSREGIPGVAVSVWMIGNTRPKGKGFEIARLMILIKIYNQQIQ